VLEHQRLFFVAMSQTRGRRRQQQEIFGTKSSMINTEGYLTRLQEIVECREGERERERKDRRLFGKHGIEFCLLVAKREFHLVISQKSSLASRRQTRSSDAVVQNPSIWMSVHKPTGNREGKQRKRRRENELSRYARRGGLLANRWID